MLKLYSYVKILENYNRSYLHKTCIHDLKCQINLPNQIFTHLKLCLATATHNFKYVKIGHIYLI